MAAAGSSLRMPHSKPLGSGLFELRFTLSSGKVDQRVTYTFEPERRVITLTAFRKTRNNEAREVKRARTAMMSQRTERKGR
ncbi:MAG: type II toxin-antitoxin system RelE/ParE family toxin [Propionibacteriaceae bacterium]|nr:type II toxin-antitoxin system RelE/ParE family toxin [Propionibacteriaceae bacterium]